MKKTLSALLIALPVVLGFSQLAQANDGRDRTQLSSAHRFELFPPPISDESGYIVLASDGPGGADGTEMFRWARPQSVSLVRIAAFETAHKLGKVEAPMAIFDLSAENGDTPVDFKEGVPRGRHPGGSHDGGINLDLGYYLKSTKGLKFQPDLAACTQHFAEDGKDLAQCQAVPDKLALAHQTLFLLELAKLNRSLFAGDLIEEIGIDHQIRMAVLQQLGNWVRGKKHGATEALKNDLARIFTSDRWEGWASYHHHHIHLRLRDISMFGRHREAYEKLRNRERLNDELLLRKAKKPLLVARLYSQGLNRSVEAEILGDEGKGARFRYEGLEPHLSDASRAPRVSASWDIPARKSGEVKISAELLGDKASASGPSYTTLISEPQQPGYLWVAVDPRQLHGSFTDELRPQVSMPEAYRIYVTKIEYQPKEITPETDMVMAELTLSSRMRVKVPIFTKTPKILGQ